MLKKLLAERKFEHSLLSDMVDRGVDKKHIIVVIDAAIERKTEDINFLNKLKNLLEEHYE